VLTFSPAYATGIGCAIPAATATVSAVGVLEAMHGAGVIGLTIYNMVNDPGPGARRGWEATPENVERMKQGKPPIGEDGHPVELHHQNQDPNGKLVPLTRTDHRSKGNYKKNHPKKGPSEIDRNQHAKERKDYWKKQAGG